MPPVSREIQQAIADIAKGSGVAGAGFAERAAAIELLEIHVLDRLHYLEERHNLSKELQALGAQAKALRTRLEGANERFLRTLRRRIQSGRCTGSELTRVLTRSAGPPGPPGYYDTLDLLVSGLLHTGARPRERAAREPEMVAYQPTPARAVLGLIARANLRGDDTFYDLGSGLGRVVLLVALLSDARAIGIEREPAYVSCAARCARRLRMRNAEFVQADARDAALSDGSVFFMYSPFRGALLRKVLMRLRAEARKRPIRVCTLGPCTMVTASEGWLRPEDGRTFSAHEVAIFQSVSQRA